MIRPPQDDIEEMEEEAAANYVNAPARTGKKMAARPGQRSRCFSQSFLPIAVCWLILLVIMGLRIYFSNRINDKISVLENQITNLTTENQELETWRDNVIGQTKKLETTWNKLNVSQAKWTLDFYCHRENQERRCRACPQGWELFGSSCYLIHPSDGKTWEDAREDCRGQGSDLVVVHDEDDQNVLTYVNRYIYGSWVGLRAEGGTWKWIDGSGLTESDRIQHQLPRRAPPGQCAVYVQYRYTSESCGERKGWICKKKASSF
ncbi:CD209 antigen-like protein E [Etheostoma spectabile]|uniref:CD209 antigen-like protein E n=1 Tax=Etheostoma spectabile TaxID=54343 RepID=UPI0013AF66F2|nr:CD209 antigen-like protein E [Etheostoma spectabile]XP_032363063.1 CD209 antigen-like protein E [Etheostoma spectabile]